MRKLGMVILSVFFIISLIGGPVGATDSTEQPDDPIDGTAISQPILMPDDGIAYGTNSYCGHNCHDK